MYMVFSFILTLSIYLFKIYIKKIKGNFKKKDSFNKIELIKIKQILARIFKYVIQIVR